MESKYIADAFIALGDTLTAYLNGESPEGSFDFRERIDEGILKACAANPWFTPKSVKRSFYAWAHSLNCQKIKSWTQRYSGLETKFHKNPSTVAVIMAGNIPLVGLHDFLSVLISGNRILAKMSDNDSELLPLISEILIEAEPELARYIEFAEGHLKDFDAVIATGSDNTYRYFEYYFGRYPNIIRKNRNSIAVLDGNESFCNLDDLCKDIFEYFGMGCRSVSKLYVPAGYEFGNIITLIDTWDEMCNHNGYRNNYDYQKSVMIMNDINFIEHRNLLVTKNFSLRSPLAVIHYEEYHSLDQVREVISEKDNEIQCVASNIRLSENSVPFGRTQEPELWDYADCIDTIDFLLRLKS